MITRLHFSINIKAEKSTIWNTLWNDSSYREWISIFSEGSYVITDNWEEGSQVLFLDPDQNGIYSIIETHIPNNKIQFKHLGSIIQGKKKPINDETKRWSGTTEVYNLIDDGDSIVLAVEVDVLDEHLGFMTEAFPKALEKVKEYCLLKAQ